MAIEQSLKKESTLRKEPTLKPEKQITPIKGENVYTGNAGDSRDRVEKLESDLRYLGDTDDDISKLRKQQDEDTRNPIEKGLGLRRNQNVVFDLAEIFDRPDNALRAATEWMLEGKNPLDGYMKGATGEAKVEWHDIWNINAEQDPELAVAVDIGFTILSIMALSLAVKAVGGVAAAAAAGTTAAASQLNNFQKAAKLTVDALDQHSQLGIKAFKGLFKVSVKGTPKVLKFVVVQSPLSKAVQKNFPNLSKKITKLADTMNAFVNNIKSKFRKNPNHLGWVQLDRKVRNEINQAVQGSVAVQDGLWSKIVKQTPEADDVRKAVYRLMSKSEQMTLKNALSEYWEASATQGIKKFGKQASAEAEKKVRFIFSKAYASAQYRFIEAINAAKYPQRYSIKGANMLFDFSLLSGLKNSKFYNQTIRGGYHSITYTLPVSELNKLPFIKKLKALAKHKFPKSVEYKEKVQNVFTKAQNEASKLNLVGNLNKKSTLKAIVKRIIPYKQTSGKKLLKLSFREEVSNKISKSFNDLVDWDTGKLRAGKNWNDLDKPIFDMFDNPNNKVNDIFPPYYTKKRKKKAIQSILERVKKSIKEELEVLVDPKYQAQLKLANVDNLLDPWLMHNNMLEPIVVLKGASGESIVKISPEFQEYLSDLVQKYFPRHPASKATDFRFYQNRVINNQEQAVFSPSVYSKDGDFTNWLKSNGLEDIVSSRNMTTERIVNPGTEVKKIKELYETLTDDYQKFALDTPHKREIERLAEALNSNTLKNGDEIIQGMEGLSSTEKEVYSLFAGEGERVLYLQKQSLAYYSKYLTDQGLDPYDGDYVLSGYFKRVVNPDAVKQLGFDNIQDFDKAVAAGKVVKGTNISTFAPRIYKNSLYTSDINEILGYTLGKNEFGIYTPLFGEVPFASVVNQLGDISADIRRSSIDLLVVKVLPHNKLYLDEKTQKNLTADLGKKKRVISRFENKITKYENDINQISDNSRVLSEKQNFNTVRANKEWVKLKTRMGREINNIKVVNKGIDMKLAKPNLSKLVKGVEDDIAIFYKDGLRALEKNTKKSVIAASQKQVKYVGEYKFEDWIINYMKKQEDYEGLPLKEIKNIKDAIEDAFYDVRKIYVETIQDGETISYRPLHTPGFTNEVVEDFSNIKELNWDKATFADWFEEVKNLKDKSRQLDIVKTLHRSNSAEFNKIVILDPKTGYIKGTLSNREGYLLRDDGFAEKLSQDTVKKAQPVAEETAKSKIKIPANEQQEVYLNYKNFLEKQAAKYEKSLKTLKTKSNIISTTKALDDVKVKLNLVEGLIEAKVNKNVVSFLNRFSKLDLSSALKRLENPDLYADGIYIKLILDDGFKSKGVVNNLKKYLKMNDKLKEKIQQNMKNIKEANIKIKEVNFAKNDMTYKVNKIKDKLDKITQNPDLNPNQRQISDKFQLEMAKEYPDDFAVKLSSDELLKAKKRYGSWSNSPQGAKYTPVDAKTYIEKSQAGLIYKGIKQGLTGGYSDTAKGTISYGIMQELNKLTSADGKIYVHNSIVGDVIRTIDQEKAQSYLGKFMDTFNSIIMKPWKKLTLTGPAPVLRSWYTNGLRAYTEVGINPAEFVKSIPAAAKRHSQFKNIVEKVFAGPEFLKRYNFKYKDVPLGKFPEKEFDIFQKEIVRVAKKEFNMPAEEATKLLQDYMQYAKAGLFGQTLMTQDAIARTKMGTNLMASYKEKDLGHGVAKLIGDGTNWSLKQYGKSDEISKMIIFDKVKQNLFLQQELLKKPQYKYIALDPSLSEVERVNKLAGAVANNTLFNFANLSEFERTTLRRYTVFLTWSLKNLQAMSISFMQNTRRFQRMYRFFKQWNEGFASKYKQSYDPDRDELPRWAQERENLILPWNMGYLNMSPTIISAAQFGQNLGLSTLHPLVKSVIQGATGIDLYKKSPLRDPSMTGGLVPNMLGPFGRKAGYGVDLVKKMFGGEEKRSALDVMAGNWVKSIDKEKRDEQVEKAYVQKLLKRNREKRQRKGWIKSNDE